MQLQTYKPRDPKTPLDVDIDNIAYDETYDEDLEYYGMEEIIEHVYFEIRNSGYEKKLFGGIVVTGGGSQLKHITQLFEYITGMDTRIGYPTEHLASTNTIENLTSPMYSTGIGLVLKGFQMNRVKKSDVISEQKETNIKPVVVNPGTEKEKRGKFFETILKRATDFLKEEDVN
jgi:cell division protein FtsA